MINSRKIVGLFTLLIGLTLAIFGVSEGQDLPDTAPTNGEVALTGIVVDASSQQPVADASVKVPLPNKQTKTDKQGKFSFDKLKNGTYKLMVEHSDYETYEKTVEIDSQSKQLVIKLQPKSQ